MTSIENPLPLAELFDHLEDVLAWVKDRDGRYLWVNRAFLINYTFDHPGIDTEAAANRILGRTDYDLSPAFLADQFRHDDEQVLAGHRIINRIERVEESGGFLGWNITTKIPVTDAQEAIIGTAGMTRPLRQPTASVTGAPNLGPVLTWMRDHYHRPISNQQLAKVAKMSQRSFERQFHAAFHLTPQKYLRKLRLRIASRALIYTTESLSDVALNCGFADQSHFTREFHRQFGRTPRGYREHYRAPAVAFRTKSAASAQSFSKSSG